MLEFLVVIIAFLGLIFGGILALVSPEEMKIGEKWFKRLRKIVLSFLFLSFAFVVVPNFIVLIVGGIIGYFVAKLFNEVYFYLGLGMLAAFFLFVDEYIVLVASLIFVFGFPEGTLRISRLKTKDWNILKRLSLNSLFFVVPFILYFVKDFFISNNVWILAFVAGGMVCLMEKETYLEVFLKISKRKKS